MRRRPPFALLLPAILLAIAAAGCGDDAGEGGSGEGGAGGSTSAGPGGMTSQSASELCLNTINQHRASIMLPPYERWTDGEACASEEAMLDAASDTPHGAFPKCDESAQNECPGWDGEPEEIIIGCLQMMWDEGPGDDFSAHGHYLNMSSTQYKQAACGFFVTEKGAVWAIQNFK